MVILYQEKYCQSREITQNPTYFLSYKFKALSTICKRIQMPKDTYGIRVLFLLDATIIDNHSGFLDNFVRATNTFILK